MQADMGSWMTMTVGAEPDSSGSGDFRTAPLVTPSAFRPSGHNAGSKEKALEVTTEQEARPEGAWPSRET